MSRARTYGVEIHDRRQASTDRLRAKARRVALLLEASLGLPAQGRELPPPLDTLVATILSQNTNDKNSHRAYVSLRHRFPSWSDVATASLRSIVSTIRCGGMANQKAPRIRETLAHVKDRFGAYDLEALRTMSDSEVLNELVAIKGVGLKTASCVLLFSLGRELFPVDTHIHRICARLGLAPGCRTPDRTFHQMASLVPPGKAYSFHTNLIRFGRRVCRTSSPGCSLCPLFAECRYPGRRRRPTGRQVKSASNHNFMLLDNVCSDVPLH